MTIDRAQNAGGSRLLAAMPPLFDVILALIVTMTTGFFGDMATTFNGSGLVSFIGILAGVLMTAPLAVRRSHPMLMLALMGVAGVLQVWFFASPSPSILVAVPVASYSMARWVPGNQARLVLYLGMVAAVAGPASWLFKPNGLAAGTSPFGLVAYFSMMFMICLGAVLAPYLLGRRLHENEIANFDRVQASQQRYEAELTRREQDSRITEARIRSDIARELHDIVAHSLSVIIVQADGGKALLTKKPEAAGEALETISETGREALTEMRRIVGVLRADPSEGAEYVPNPTLTDIPAMVSKAGDRVSLQVTGKPPWVPATLGLTAYRVVQEAVTNFLKHAGPDARARVSIDYTPQAIVIEIADNGLGAAASSDGAGHGLRGMHERVSSMGGWLDAGPGLGGGYLVRARLPLSSPAGYDPSWSPRR